MGHQNRGKSIYSERLDKTESSQKNSTAQRLRVKFEAGGGAICLAHTYITETDKTHTYNILYIESHTL